MHHRHARVGGAAGLGLRAAPDRPDATGCRAPTRCRPTGSSSRDMLDAAREEGADAALLGAVERAQPPVLLLAAARRAARRGAAERLGRRRTSRSPDALRQALDKAPGDQRYVLGEVAVHGPAAADHAPPSTSSSTRCPRELAVRRARVDAAHLHRRRGRGRRRRRAAEAPRAARDLPIWMTETGAGAPRTASARAPAAAPPSCAAAAACTGILKTLVPRPADHRRDPVHAARGRRVPDRPRHHRPHARLPGAEGVAAVGPRGARAPRGPAARQAALRLIHSTPPRRSRDDAPP